LPAGRRLGISRRLLTLIIEWAPRLDNNTAATSVPHSLQVRKSAVRKAKR
jgi:hypothetical protein